MTRSLRPLALTLLAVLAMAAAPARAQQSKPPPQAPADIAALKKEIEELKAMLLAIQKDVQETKAILQKITQPPPQARGPVYDVNVEFSTAGAPMRGSRAATVAIVEFSDYQCPFCARYAAQTWPQVNSEYVEAGRVQYFFVNFPIEQLHPLAFKAHQAAICAGEQGKYWEMHDRLFANQSLLQPQELTKHAAAVGLDMGKFQPCFETDRTAEGVRKDLARIEPLGIDGTPTFLIGSIDPNETTVKGVKMISGAQPFAVFKQTIAGVINGR
jgi:protein-disulfide isomerase